MKNYQLNAKLKILIIVFYTLILFGVLLLTLGKSNASRFENYETKSYDENIAITIREMENRKSKYQTGDKKELGEHEKSTFDLQITLVKLQTKAVIDNIKIYVTAQTVDGGYRYKEYSSSTKKMSEYTYTSTTSFSSIAEKEYDKVTKDEVTEEFLFNEEPTNFFVKVTYSVGEETTTRTLTYKTSVLDFKKSQLEKAEKRSIIGETEINNPSYVDPKEDPVRVKFTKTPATEATKLGEVKEDLLKVQFYSLKTNLNKYKHTDEFLKQNQLKTVEIPTSLDDEKAWDVYPEISEIKFEIYAKIKGTDKDFSEYVKIYSIYGFMSKYRDLATASVKLDETFDIEDIYIIGEGKLINSTKDSFSFLYTCKYSEVLEAK